ncbi:MAG TPA: hypothetical protein DDY58_06470, partial [Terrisporobacter glycolicus]|nr:hypothetical protein [Terrisporobacter hibernicus]
MCKTQILVVSKSTTKDKEISIAKTMCNSFKSITNDNELICKEVKKEVNLDSVMINNLAINSTSVD